MNLQMADAKDIAMARELNSPMTGTFEGKAEDPALPFLLVSTARVGMEVNVGTGFGSSCAARAAVERAANPTAGGSYRYIEKTFFKKVSPIVDEPS